MSNLDKYTKEGWNTVLWSKLRRGEVDVNDQQLFLSTVLKGLIYNLNNKIKIRNQYIPHYIVNTGDDILYLEVKGQDHSKEPLEITNEDFIYTTIPRCVISPGSIDILADQLTSPYSRGNFTLEYDDSLYSFNSEFRRVPIKLSISLKYVLDNFTDSLQLVQQVVSNCAFINNFNIEYLGRTIQASYSIPTEYGTEHSIEFDGLTADSKTHNLEIDIDIETNFPMIYQQTIIPCDAYIRNFRQEHIIGSDHERHGFDITLYENDSSWSKDRTTYILRYICNSTNSLSGAILIYDDKEVEGEVHDNIITFTTLDIEKLKTYDCVIVVTDVLGNRVPFEKQFTVANEDNKHKSTH